jgi:parallel beta-helix repeat protein
LVCGFWLLAIARVFAGNFYAGTSPTTIPWPGGIVPYEFTNTLTAAQTNTYLNGLREWQLAANVRFVPHTNQTHWILFAYNTNGFDNVSASTNPQVVSVSSLSRAQVCHEMGHSFGFTHENIRPDATNYIAVLTNNIANEPSNIFWFTDDPTTVTNGNYDFESVMHLGWDFDSTNPGVLATQQPRPPNFPRYQFRMGNYCLSPGDRAALAYLYGPPAVPPTNLVTNTADAGPGSLRAAIYYATDHPGATIRFNIATNDPGYSNGVFNIHLTGLLPPLVANGTVIDGSTQPGFAGKPLIVVDGSQMIPEAYAPGTATGLLIYSSSNQIKDISFSGFNWNGLTLVYADATNNTISGCWFGLDPTGTNAAPNAYQGIFIASGASGNTIGGTNALTRNVLSGNSQYGIFITDSNTTGNVVLGNYIGTDASGSNAVPNGKSGVIIGGGTTNNVVGSTNPAGRNILSGNTEYGIYLTNTTGNVILGNYLGVNASGEIALANQKSGVALFGGTQNVIGGTVAGAGNVLSGNGNYGIDIGNPVATGNWVQGNLIGLDAAGTNGIGNGNGYGGVLLDSGATNNTIGGTVAGARNVISGNAPAGVFFNGASTSGNLIEGNYIGTDITGTNAVPNTLAGIYLPDGTLGNVIGGTIAGARNVISGNYYGVYLANPATSGNVIEGNYIGISPDGTEVVGSAFAGIIIFAGATNNTIGGTIAGAGNVISGFYGYGIYIDNVGTSGNWIEGNDIGTDGTGTKALPNSTGLIIFGGATNNIIGIKPDGSGSGNQIAFNNGDGVLVGDTNTVGIAIRGNSIFGNGGLGIDLVNGGNNLQNFPVVTNAFAYATSTIVSGTLNSLANSAFFIDVYRNAANDPGEGEFYVGTVSVATDGSGNGTFTLTAAGNYAGQYFTATATSAGGDTSEFSADLLAVNGPAAQFTGPYQSRTNGFAFSLTLQTNFSYHIQAATNLVAPVAWTDLTNFTATSSPFSFTDHSATNYRVRFYRVVSP